MSAPLHQLVELWCVARSISPRERPDPEQVQARFARWNALTRPPARLSEVRSWEGRHGFELPEGLKAWLALSDGLQLDGPLIHPLAAIGPMIPFARVPNLVVQPESWFELGNPNVETVCMDLAYRWTWGDCPLFTSGDDQTGSAPKIIATGFDEWFLKLMEGGGHEYWFDPGFPDLGDVWASHRRHVPEPILNDRLKALAPEVAGLLRAQNDDGSIAQRLGVTRFDVEAIARFLQHQQ